MIQRRPIYAAALALLLTGAGALAARGETPAAFDGRCIPAGGVAPRSSTPGMLDRRALPAGRLARPGATPAFHHGLPARASGEDSASVRRQAFDLAYNLEHEAAVAMLRKATIENPSDAAAHRALASVLWLNMLFSRG